MKNELIKYYDLPTFFGKSLINDLFGSCDETYPSVYRNQIGSVNIVENEKNYVIEISAPGFKKDEINVSILDGYITINGEINKQNNIERNKYSRREFSKTSFKRSFALPDDITEELTAKFEDGILSVTINKKEPEPKKVAKSIMIE